MIPIGRVLSAHGVQGEVGFKYYNASTEDFYRYTSFITEVDGKSMVLYPESVRFGKSFLIVKFKGYNNPDEVFFLVNRELCVKEEDLPVLQDNEFYVYQLIGMIVSDVDGAKLGAVKEVLHTGACDIVVVENDKELLIPMIEEYILEIDTMKGQIKVTRDAIADAR